MARKRNKDECGTTYAEYERNYDGVVVGDLVQDDIGAVLQMGINSIRKYGKKLPTYEPTSDGLSKFKERTIEYLEHVRMVNMDPEMSKKVVCDIEGWCVFLGITRQTLHRYYNSRSSEWKAFIDYAKEIIAMAKKQNAMTFRTPPMIAVFDLVNNHNYHNSNEFHISTEKTDEEQTLIAGQTIEKALEQNGLVWDDEKGEFVPMEE